MMQAPSEVRELLAEQAHVAWSAWMKYMFGKCYNRGGDTLVIPAALVERWSRQMNTEYADLPENEKESDRQEADRYWEVVASCLGGSPGAEGSEGVV